MEQDRDMEDSSSSSGYSQSRSPVANPTPGLHLSLSAATSTSSAGSSSMSSGRKTFSCVQCRHRKVKCQKTNPCKNCMRRGETCRWAPSAVFSSPQPLASPPLPTPPLQSPPLLPSLSRHVSASTSVFQRIPPTATATSPTQSTSPIATSKPQPSAALDSKSQEAFDHSILLNSTSPSLSATVHTPSSVAAGSPAFMVENNAVGNGKRKESGASYFPWSDDWTQDELDQLLKFLPGKSVADALVNLYLERVDWIHKPLHVPSFLASYNNWWKIPSNSRTPSNTSPSFLALLFIIMVLGMHFSEHPIKLELGEDQRVDEERLYKACQRAMSAANFLGSYGIDKIQIIILLCLWLNNTDKSETAHSLFAIAVKMAVSLGLHRIPLEETCPSRGLMDREMGRRLWWSLVCQDTYTASSCNLAHLISLSESSTEFFGNSNDDDLVPDREGVELNWVNRSKEEVTESGFHLAKIPFALVTRDYHRELLHSSPSPPYRVILSLDQAYRNIYYHELPRFLRPDLSQSLNPRKQLVWEKIFTGITLNNRLVRLHRTYAMRGYDDDEFSYSTSKCLEAAWGVLELAKESVLVQFPGRRWWVVLVHIWTAGLVIALDLLRDPRPDRPDGHTNKAEKRGGIELALQLLSPTRFSSPVSERACGYLRGFLDQDSARRLPSPPPPTHQQLQHQHHHQHQHQQLEEIFDPTSFDALFAWDFSNPHTEPSEEFWNSIFGNSGSGSNEGENGMDR